MNPSAILLGVGGMIYLTLGAAHGILTLRDVTRPRSFTPVDDAVRRAMEGAPMPLHPSTDLWKAWLGFNLSHSLGLVVFGGALVAIIAADMGVYQDSRVIQIAAAMISGIYLTLAARFWFVAPAVASAAATFCIVAAAALS